MQVYPFKAMISCVACAHICLQPPLREYMRWKIKVQNRKAQSEETFISSNGPDKYDVGGAE